MFRFLRKLTSVIFVASASPLYDKLWMKGKRGEAATFAQSASPESKVRLSLPLAERLRIYAQLSSAIEHFSSESDQLRYLGSYKNGIYLKNTYSFSSSNSKDPIMSSPYSSISIDLRAQPIEGVIKQLNETTAIEVILLGTQEISDADMLQVIRAIPKVVRILDLPDCSSRPFLDRAFNGEATLCLEIGRRPLEKILFSDTFFCSEERRTEMNYAELLERAYCSNRRDVVEKLLNILPSCDLEEKKILLSRTTPGYSQNPIMIASTYAYGYSGSYQEKPSPAGSSADVEFLLQEVSTLPPYEMRCILNQRRDGGDLTIDSLRRMIKEKKQEFFKHLSTQSRNVPFEIW